MKRRCTQQNWYRLIEWEWLIRGMRKLKWGKRQVFNPSVGAKSALRQGHRFEFLLVFFIQMASLQLVHVILIQWSLFLPSPPFVLSHACTATLFFQYSSLYCIYVLQYSFPQWPASLYNRDWVTILPWSLPPSCSLLVWKSSRSSGAVWGCV